jgi:hypothetical protein
LYSEPLTMFAEQIEKMKRDYTDKYVMVDATRPELARFRDIVGRVKTVNMNGRALVEFDDYHVNIGWFDIAPEYLKVVDKPPPKAPKTEAKKAAPKAAPAAKKTAAAPASAGGAAAKAGKPSVADILAAARAGKAGGATAAKASSGSAPAAAKTPAAPSASPKVDKSKMSVADMIAAAPPGGAGGAAAAAPEAKAPAVKPQAETEPQEEAEEAAASPAAKAPPPAAKSTEKIDKSKMSIDDIIAWCREHDSK